MVGLKVCATTSAPGMFLNVTFLARLSLASQVKMENLHYLSPISAEFSSQDFTSFFIGCFLYDLWDQGGLYANHCYLYLTTKRL